MNKKPTSFRLSQEAQENLEDTAQFFGLSQNQIINILLTEPHFEIGFETGDENPTPYAIDQVLYQHFSRIFNTNKSK